MTMVSPSMVQTTINFSAITISWPLEAVSLVYIAVFAHDDGVSLPRPAAPRGSRERIRRGPHRAKGFGISASEARELHVAWMKSFSFNRSPEERAADVAPAPDPRFDPAAGADPPFREPSEAEDRERRG